MLDLILDRWSVIKAYMKRAERDASKAPQKKPYTHNLLVLILFALIWLDSPYLEETLCEGDHSDDYFLCKK